MKNLFVPLIGAALIAGAPTAHAASFNFNYTYDGTSITQDAGSDTADGTSLSVGDDFTIMLSAAGDDYFSVINNLSATLPVSYDLTQGATRTGNIVSSFFLDGSLVNTITEMNQPQSFVHIGSQVWDLTAGLEFDKVILTYDFLAISNANSTILEEDVDIFGAFLDSTRPFFNNPDISYVEAGVIPLPATLPLLAFAIAGFAVIGRRRRST